MADMTTHNTIDLIVQAAYKYRFISKPGRTLFGRALIAANAAAVEGASETLDVTEYRFTPFARKFKRDAVSGAIKFYIDQASQEGTWEGSEEQRIVMKTAEKNAVKAGHRDDIEPGTYQHDEDGEDGDEVYVPGMVNRTAFQVHLSAIDYTNAPWSDITDDQRDPESDEYASSVMVRPIEVIQAERQAERDRIMAERTAQLATQGRPATSQDPYLDDEDDDDLPDDEEDL